MCRTLAGMRAGYGLEGGDEGVGECVCLRVGGERHAGGSVEAVDFGSLV